MANAYLAMYLDAPLQSWGYMSRFDPRTTLAYPTRSGLLGLVCAAMGIDKADAAGLRRLDALRVTVLAFQQGPVLVDYHTVGGGYDEKKEPLRIPHAANAFTRQGGLKATGARTAVTYREYHQHARFGAVLEGSAELIDEIARALADPVWGVWLGRKACIPASPVGQGVFDSRDEAITHLEQLAGKKAWRIVTEVERFDEGTDTLMDRPLDFRKRQFAPRRVCVEHPPS